MLSKELLKLGFTGKCTSSWSAKHTVYSDEHRVQIQFLLCIYREPVTKLLKQSTKAEVHYFGSSRFYSDKAMIQMIQSNFTEEEFVQSPAACVCDALRNAASADWYYEIDQASK